MSQPEPESAPRSVALSMAKGVVRSLPLARVRSGRAALSPDLVLRTGPQAIDQARLAAYQRVCGARVSDVLPPGYLHVLGFPLAMARMTQADFPFPLLGLVHVVNRTSQHRQLTLADRPRLAVHAANLRPHRSGQQVDIITEARLDDALVWTETSTYLCRGRREERRNFPQEPPNSPQDPPNSPQERHGVGIRFQVPADVGRRYAAVSGDRNPIHLSAMSARLFGFRRAIAHGMWLQARLLSCFEGRLPDQFVVECEFRKPVPLPGDVRLIETRPALRPSSRFFELQGSRDGRTLVTGRLEDRSLSAEAPIGQA
ncbi:MAG: MaoC domain protein dehydratase [Frankiales bacterium]|nr:MaoC domain protein dehydratase [Frankiales bacterium]